MFSFFTKKAANVVRLCSWHDPTAIPAAPILLASRPPITRPLSVHWWNANTVSIVGLLSPNPCDGEPPFGFSAATGQSYLPEHSGDISWPTIGETESFSDISSYYSLPSPPGPQRTITRRLLTNSRVPHENLLAASESSGDPDPLVEGESFDAPSIYSLPSAERSPASHSTHEDQSVSLEFNLDLPTIREDGDLHDNSSVSSLPSAHSSQRTFIIHSPNEGLSGLSESNPSPPLSLDSWLNSPAIDLSERDETVTFGVGRPLRRVATITRAVGEAIRKRRNGEATENFDARTLEKLMRRRDYTIPHLLTCIEEKEEEEC